MGMYDSIIIDHLICPYCKKRIKNIDFQTKDGYCVLATFHMGDIFLLGRKSQSYSKSKVSCYSKSNVTWIEGLGHCPKCHTFNKTTMESVYTWLEAFFLIDNRTHRIIQFEMWRFMRDLPKAQRQRKYFKKKKPQVFNPSNRK